MAKSINEVMTPEIIASYYNERKNELPPFLLEAWFPREKQLGLELSWIKGANNAPVALLPSAFDAKAVPRSFGDIDKVTTDMPFFKNTYPIDEKTRQDINTLLQSAANNERVTILLNKVLDRIAKGINDAEVTAEILRASLLTSGAVTVSGNGVAFTYDYKLPELNKGEFTWTDKANADAVGDINDKMDAIAAETGVRPDAIIINRKTFNKLKTLNMISNAFIIASGIKKSINTEDLIAYIESETNSTVYIYDGVYKNSAGTSVKFIPDDSIVLLPNSPIGRTAYGTTPEESDLMNSLNADVSIVNTGVAISRYVEKDPVVNVIKVSEIVLPSGEDLDKIYCGTINWGE